MSVGGDGTILAIEGIATGLYRPAPAQAGLGVESEQRLRLDSTSCAVVMAWISTNWWYILSTPSVVSGGEVLGGLATAASV
jgi:hypothetical protein